MRRLLVVAAVVICAIFAVGSSGQASATPSGGGGPLPGETLGPTEFKSQLGFRVDIPAGWAASSFEDAVYVHRPGSIGFSIFEIKSCPGSTPESCLDNQTWPAKLVGKQKITLAGHPAMEYRFERQNNIKDPTRVWSETHSTLRTRGKTYAIIVKLYRHMESDKELWSIYQGLKDSFRLVD